MPVPHQLDTVEDLRVIDERGPFEDARVVAAAHGHPDAEIGVGLLLVEHASGHRHWRRRWLALPAGGETAYIAEIAPGMSVWNPVPDDEHAHIRLEPDAPPPGHFARVLE